MNKLKQIGFTAICIFGLSFQASAQFKQAPLPYAYDALEPYIDAQTMEIHYSKHHAGYIANLNKALEGVENAPTSIYTLMANISNYSTVVKNNAGGYFNHTLFWETLAPASDQKPSEKLLSAINSTFGDLDEFKEKMNRAAMTQFGSGWAWLILKKDSTLAIISTANQDNPLMDDAEVKGTPLIAIDVWEHAYYLKYQNKRGDYLGAIWNVLNWSEISKRYAFAMRSSKDVFTAWKELDDFHTVMDGTFHPAEDGNFDPIKKEIKNMVKVAKKLKKNAIPTLFDSEMTKIAVADLEKGTLAFQKSVKNKKMSKEDLMKEFEELHHKFHKVLDLARMN